MDIENKEYTNRFTSLQSNIIMSYKVYLHTSEFDLRLTIRSRNVLVAFWGKETLSPQAPYLRPTE